MNLGLAGALSGAGEAGTKSLSMAQAQFGASQLQEQRDKMDTLRQERLIEAQAKLHGETLAAGERQHKETLAQGKALQTERLGAEEKNLGTKIGSEDKQLTMKIGAEKEMLGTKIKSEEKLAGKKITSEEGIHQRANDVALAVAKITAASHTRAASASDNVVAQKELASKRHELTLLLKDASNVMSDPSNPATKKTMDIITESIRDIDETNGWLKAHMNIGPSDTKTSSSSLSVPSGMVSKGAISTETLQKLQAANPNATIDQLRAAIMEKGYTLPGGAGLANSTRPAPAPPVDEQEMMRKSLAQ